jgi:hypothetical protein
MTDLGSRPLPASWCEAVRSYVLFEGGAFDEASRQSGCVR